MNAFRYSGVALAFGIAAISAPVHSNIWVFEPSIALDQRFDDNYYLLPEGGSALSATRTVGDLGLSRESEVSSIRARIRADALLTTETDVGDEDLDYNALIALDAKWRSPRARFGLAFNLKLDTPSRDIAADISEDSSVASDSTLVVTQSLSSNVARTEIVLKPNYQFDITRRLVFDSNATLTVVEHELPAPQDAIYQFYLDTLPKNPDGTLAVEPLPYNEVDINTVNVFSPSGELDDFVEAKFELGFKYKITPISTFSASAGYSRFVAQVEPDPAAVIPFEDLIADPDVPEIRRKPRRDSIATTNTFKLGYDRFLKPNLQLALVGGVYTNTTDNTDTLRASDSPPADTAFLESETDGWLASVGLTFNSGSTRYSGRFAVDVQPSSAGSQVETNELTGELFRTLSPRSTFVFRARAYEPDRLAANSTDRFARRFISFEPKLQWRFTRNWTLTSAYRYRRQKARVDPVSAESHAVLVSVKYTPPSEIRDAANQL